MTARGGGERPARPSCSVFGASVFRGLLLVKYQACLSVRTRKVACGNAERVHGRPPSRTLVLLQNLYQYGSFIEIEFLVLVVV